MGPKILLLKVLGNLRTTDSVIEKENNRVFASSSNIITPLSGNYPSAAGRSIEGASTSFDVGATPKFSKYGTVTATLEAKTGSLEILKALRSSKIFEDVYRKALVKIVTSELVDYHQSHYPPQSAKVALAKALITEFPRLKNEYSKDGWEHFYDQNSKNGFIEYRLSTMRTKLSPSKKKYTKAALKKSEGLSSSSQSADYQFTSEEIDKKVRC
ncbi:uncharacterized protein LOC123264049 [Cotesia glomerata]|uniref:uncharacterized protein LOC123264049 n=1 Tax=Cotesia glomerata TaxID=32391 RepID=UPI001D02E9EE|nr:uncharacterized protein LOC123264049 [Cotesia glomerata]